MTAPRAKVSASLADRGRPEMWVNEQESAVLSGMEIDKYYASLPRLEASGFPKKNPWNNKRFVPTIIDFWKREVDAARFEVPKSAQEEEQRGNFSHAKGQRVASA
jgi:hypothetical protein